MRITQELILRFTAVTVSRGWRYIQTFWYLFWLSKKQARVTFLIKWLDISNLLKTGLKTGLPLITCCVLRAVLLSTHRHFASRIQMHLHIYITACRLAKKKQPQNLLGLWLLLQSEGVIYNTVVPLCCPDLPKQAALSTCWNNLAVIYNPSDQVISFLVFSVTTS